MALPITAEISAWLVLRDQRQHGAELLTIRHAAAIFPESGLLGVSA
jgi:hypothetical protein